MEKSLGIAFGSVPSKAKVIVSKYMYRTFVSDE